jgi:hypothetical protein
MHVYKSVKNMYMYMCMCITLSCNIMQHYQIVILFIDMNSYILLYFAQELHTLLSRRLSNSFGTAEDPDDPGLEGV